VWASLTPEKSLLGGKWSPYYKMNTKKLLFEADLRRGVNRGMQIRRSVPFFAKSVDPPIVFVQIRKVNVNATATSNLAQIVKKVTYLMTTTKCNSNNSPTPEFN